MKNKYWVWNWVGGGYNSCTAPTLAQALVRASEIGTPHEYSSGKFTTSMGIDVKTLREVTCEELNEIDAYFASMCH